VRWNHFGPNNAYGPRQMRASPDGSVLLGWDGGWAGLEVATFKKGKQVDARDRFEFSMGLFALPSADARYIFTPWAIANRQLEPAKVAGLKDHYLLPTHEGGFFLALDCPGLHDAVRRDNGRLPTPEYVKLYTTERKKLYTLPQCKEWDGGSDLPWEKRLHYFPAAGLLVSLATGNDKLVLRHLDMAKALERVETDYLFVASEPGRARPGQQFTYRLDVRAKKGGVKVKLDKGPEGLKVSPEGLVSWDVPGDAAETEVEVLVTVADGAEQEMFHRFTIVIGPRLDRE
jgi:hypothetical protein